MIALRFPSLEHAKNFGDMIDASANAISEESAQFLGEPELLEIVSRIKNYPLFIIDESDNILLIRSPEDVLFALEYMEFILENSDPSDLQLTKESQEKMVNEIKNGISIIRTLSQEPEEDGNRRYYPMLEEIYSSNIGSFVKFEKDLDVERIFGVPAIPNEPKVGELWKILEYHEADPEADEPEEDYLVLQKKDDKVKLVLPTSEVYPITSLYRP